MRDGASPRDSDVPAAEAACGGVIGNGDVPGPVGVLAPHLGPSGVLEEVREVNVGGCVEVARDGVAVVGHAE